MRNSTILLSLLAILCSAAADSREVVTRLSGSGSSTTREFEVAAPWILDWRVNSDYPQSMAIEISLVDADTGFHQGLIVQTKQRGDGVKLFRQGGRYRFRISSTLTYWDLRIEELTPQEAEAYTPKRSGPGDKMLGSSGN
ncbi:MAG TPA: hypothetical protein VFE85_05370 [Woeseiaceae bacterium]|nr:hypothetical protein [Woeseiaceae bacterium]